MSKWVAEFELEDGDTMPEDMNLNCMGANIDFHCRPMWIPVSERLPDKVGTYMTAVDYDQYGIAVGQRYYHGKGIGWEDDCVIAWMPLPDPYVPDINVGKLAESEGIKNA